MANWEEQLQHWESVGVVDAATVERVRAYEAQRETPSEHRWQVAVLLALGLMLLVGGLMLFVAAHWDQVSPWTRLVLVMGFLAVFHALAIVCVRRFPAIATALHGIGTAGAGAAILTIGEIFNMQEHWPTAVLLWAVCAGAGWWLLRDQVQQTITMMLVPAWLVCEWSYRAQGYEFTGVYIARMSAVIAAVFLTGFIRSPRRGVFWALYIQGLLGLICSVSILSEGWNSYGNLPMVPRGLQIAAVVVIAIVVAAGWLWERRNLLPVLAVTLMSYLLPWRKVYSVVAPGSYNGVPYTREEPSSLMYALVAVTAVSVAWWGLRHKSRAVVNYAVVAFGLTVLWFYFSSLMDKFGRSLGLIGLGILFLAGGAVLERVRRQLMADMAVKA
jgi:uncharacterized membrane protein